MSEMISRELQFLGASFLWGCILMSCYDVLRILRKIVPHPFLLTAVEDATYWLVGGLLVFRMIYERNDGTIRSYSVIALLLGMFLYYILVGEKVVRMVAGVWRKAFDGVKKVSRRLLRPIRLLLRKMKKIIKNLKNVLKSMKKTVTIACKRH